jgi:hypothetical protein
MKRINQLTNPFRPAQWLNIVHDKTHSVHYERGVFLIPTFKDDVLDRFFHALEKVQESPQDLALLKDREKMIEAMELLKKT